ncbi:lysosomal alpha-glucosidase-like isoform X3 [Lycorma delicatula]|uniref:lysosomal alpha-glucosidase-like isoform X3 n=1 Tax=Lycorma delicatula TaxID=130591 RepID=UPI003F512A3B
MAALNLNENKDVQWNDIDYVVRRNDFTYDKVNFKGLDKFVDDLHKKGMHYFVIMDPGVSGREPNGTYSPYDDVIAQDILMKDFTGNKPLIGRCLN